MGTVTGPYAAQFNAAGAKYNVDPALLSAVAKAESDYNPKSRSGVGAEGLMQIMPGTARELGINPNDPTQAIDGAARLLSGYLRKYNGDIAKTAAAYNAGPGAVSKYGGVPPYQETQTYVKRVSAYFKELGGGAVSAGTLAKTDKPVAGGLTPQQILDRATKDAATNQPSAYDKAILGENPLTGSGLFTAFQDKNLWLRVAFIVGGLLVAVIAVSAFLKPADSSSTPVVVPV